MQPAWSEMLFYTKNESLQLCIRVGQGLSIVTHALMKMQENKIMKDAQPYTVPQYLKLGPEIMSGSVRGQQG